MKSFLDTGFMLTLLIDVRGSREAKSITDTLAQPLHVFAFQRFATENRLLREVESSKTTPAQKAAAAKMLARLKQYTLEQVFLTTPADYDVAILLAEQWQAAQAGNTLSFQLLLWPALAVTSGGTHFLSFDPRTRRLAAQANLTVLPERLR